MATYADLRNALDGLISRGGLDSRQVAAIHAALRQGGNWSSPEAKDAFARLGIDLNTDEGQSMAATMQQAYRLVVTNDENAVIGKEGNWDMFAQSAIQKFSGQQAPGGGQQAPTSALDTPEGQGISSQIQAFINSMMGPVGPGDATYDTIMRSATNAAQAYGGKAGLNARSSLGNTAAGSLATAGVAAYEQQRRELGLQGMNTLANYDIQLGQLQQQWTAMQNGIAEQKASAEQAQRTATGQVVGGVIGAIPGIIAAPYTGGASLGLIGAGSAIGGGVAGSTMGAPKYQTNYSGPKGRNPYTGF